MSLSTRLSSAVGLLSPLLLDNSGCIHTSGKEKLVLTSPLRQGIRKWVSNEAGLPVRSFETIRARLESPAGHLERASCSWCSDKTTVHWRLRVRLYMKQFWLSSESICSYTFFDIFKTQLSSPGLVLERAFNLSYCFKYLLKVTTLMMPVEFHIL